ncbi:NADP transhydrogenase subunit alpha [Psychrobacter frigidicola]|uniref:NADP transhydrogenase subunit alpha n=1 Tax=Psychrobacter frigidicola TaxID=45611 RepID=A0A5C7A874_9GAMM|nr:NAD(P)-binding protein [Psychrobacter frigidicola]TXD96960.1 NADP transhydrogenase subunit alpha [Psychrobacter frigidicola]
MTDHSLSQADNGVTIKYDHTIPKIVPKIAIIGGGLTGLFTATLLERAFSQQVSKAGMPQITIFEKSRSVGRLATRYRTDTQTNKNWQWAFGAQFFTAKTDSFSQFIKPWLDTGLLQPWCAEVVELTPANDNQQPLNIQQKEQWDTVHARYISTPKMTSWGRVLADELRFTTVKFRTRVAPLIKKQNNNLQDDSTDNKTELFDDSGASLGGFDWVICTAPNGQAVELMAGSGFTKQAKTSKPQMQACYTLMLGWDDIEHQPETLNNTAALIWDVAYVNDSPLDRIFIEQHKPAHGDLLPSVTIHARNDWSQAHVDEDVQEVQAQLLAAAQQALNWNSDTAPSQIDCHRWRYAATIVNTDDKDNFKESGILVDNTHQWIVSGDWCGQGNIESCYLMAVETVAAINEVSNK